MAKKGLKQRRYSTEFKISVIMDMREHRLGYRETARKQFPFCVRKNKFSRYNKVPLQRLPFHPSASPKPPQKFHSFREKAPQEQKTTAPSSAKGGCFVL